MNDFDRLDRDRIGILTGAFLLALALGRFLDLLARPISLPWFRWEVDGSRLGPWFLAIMVVGLTVSGTVALIRNHPRNREQASERVAMYCLLPTAVALGLALNLAELVDLEQWLIALVAAGVLFTLTLALEYRSVSPRARSVVGWQWGMLAIHHLTMLLLYLAIVGWPTPALVQGVVAFVATWLLVARLLWGMQSNLTAAFIHGGVAGVIMAQAAWVVAIWPLARWRAALLLLVVLYVVVGMLIGQQQQRLTRRVVLEYGVVALAAVLVLGLIPA